MYMTFAFNATHNARREQAKVLLALISRQGNTLKNQNYGSMFTAESHSFLYISAAVLEDKTIALSSKTVLHTWTDSASGKYYECVANRPD